MSKQKNTYEEPDEEWRNEPRRTPDLPSNITRLLIAIIVGIFGLFGCLTVTIAITLQLTGNLDPLICKLADTCPETPFPLTQVPPDIAPPTPDVTLIPPTLYPTPIPPTSLPSPQPSPTSIATFTPIPPSFFGTIEVPGASNAGEQFIASQAGTYIFRYKGGGYCVYGTDPGFANCLPTIVMFETGVPLWEDDGRTLNVDFAVRRIAALSNCNAGRGAYCNSISEAESWGLQSSEIRLRMSQGMSVTLIGIDHREAYSDNPGQVFIDVYYVPQ